MSSVGVFYLEYFFWGTGREAISDLGANYMVSFSPGLKFAPTTGLKFCCDYIANFSPGTINTLFFIRTIFIRTLRLRFVPKFKKMCGLK